MDPVIINSLSDYVGTIVALHQNIPSEWPDNYTELLFRGQSSCKYELCPSISRNRESALDISIFLDERRMIDLAKLKMPNVFHNNLTPIELLSLLQHHGIPTRLLDITENAFVALFFACSGDADEDGEVFVFKNDSREVSTYPIINAIADSYRFLIGTHVSLERFYRHIEQQPYYKEQYRASNDAVGSVDWIVGVCRTPLFIHAPIQTQRQQAQKGRYILFPNSIEEFGSEPVFSRIIKPLDKQDTCIEKRIRIPKELKEQLLNELVLFGISKSSLFPDNIDLVCDEIKQYSKTRTTV